MIERLRSTTLFVLYQLTLVAGILLLPVGILARQAGVPFPIHRVIRRLSDAHDRAQVDG